MCFIISSVPFVERQKINMKYKIAVCGMGPHTKKCHYAILGQLSKEYDISIELLIDLKCRQTIIEQWLIEADLQPKKCLFLENTRENILGLSIDQQADEALTELLKEGNLNKLMVSTEPKAHKIYLLWGLQHDIDVIVDKPLTANEVNPMNAESSKLLVSDYEEIHEAVKQSNGKLYVMIPKRKRPSYTIMKEYADNFIKEYKVPLTYIGMNIYEGMWNMPDEFYSRENHPYKYGYGGLLHSGYHYTDYILWLMESNSILNNCKIDKLSMNVMFTTPNDFVHQIPNEFYNENMNKDYSSLYTKDSLEKYCQMGELDTFLQFQGYNGDVCITNVGLNLLHTSFSSRSSTELPADTYSQNGRVHHHTFCLQFGTLCSIYSTQKVYPYDEKMPYEEELNGDCIIEIFRNTDIIGGKPYEKIVFDEEANKIDREYHGKRAEIEDWLSGTDSICEFTNHLKNIVVIQKIYEEMARIRLKKPSVSLDLSKFE